MEKNDYRIVLLGIQSDKDPDLVRKRLAQVFRSPVERVEQLLSKVPVIVRSGANYQAALKCREIIENAGGVCRVDPMEDVSPATSPPPKSAPTIRTCPNCGYSARTPDDPLLTAYDGLGECPACGIIVAKFSGKRDSSIQESSPLQDETEKMPTKCGSILSSILSRPWISLLMVIAVVILGKNIFFSKSKLDSDGDSAPKSVAANQGKKDPAKKKTDRDRVVIPKILPGETMNVVLATYLDFLHRDTFSPLSITTRGRVENKWEEEGLRVEILNVGVEPVSVSLWEHLRAKDNFWVPTGYEKISSQGGSHGAIEKGKNLLFTPYPAALVKKPEKTSMKVDAADPNYRKSAYTMYRVEYELSISVPSGPGFGSRDLAVITKEGKSVPRIAREGDVCINIFVEWDLDSAAEALGSFSQTGAWKATKAAVLRNKKVCLAMKHATRTEGVMIAPREKYCESPGYCELEEL
jgi:hypothetical protein